MPNSHVEERLKGIHSMLKGVHQGGGSMSSASKGMERNAFIDLFLKHILTPQYRFGTGDATDTSGLRSGQLDVVVEHPWVPSLPLIGCDGPRLYLAEGVAAVIEVKSDVADQWQDVVDTSSKLKKLSRRFSGGMRDGYVPN